MIPLPMLGLPPRTGPSDGPLVDGFGRAHTALRVSVTDRCDLRCTYCMPERPLFRPAHELLTFAEIERFVRAVAPLGVSKIRLTGGEPLLRPGLPDLVGGLTRMPGVDSLALTTNGTTLARHSEALYRAGLRRLTVSLDTLDPGRFRELTRRDGPAAVLAGIAAAQAAGFERVKVNAVCIRGATDGDILPLARYCRDHRLELRFIESMPIGGGTWSRDDLFPADTILAVLEAEFGQLTPAPGQDPHAPALVFEYADRPVRVGVIASVTRPFCGQCNRLRLTADGKLRNCLFARDETDIRPFLAGSTTEALIAAVRDCVQAKGEGHDINTARFVRPSRTMHEIGG